MCKCLGAYLILPEWTRTEREAQLAAAERSSSTTCIALLLLGIKTLRVCQRYKSWSLFGQVNFLFPPRGVTPKRNPPAQANRMMLDLGFHRDDTMHSRHQTHRRIYWVCFIWDKLLSIECE